MGQMNIIEKSARTTKIFLAFRVYSKSGRKEEGHEDWTDNKDMQKKKLVIEQRGREASQNIINWLTPNHALDEWDLWVALDAR